MRNQYVDVIIPTYNGLPWIKKTIESVLSQSHKYIKVYIIDDGSIDGTENYIKQIKDRRVHYYKKKNGGVSSARNYGIKISKSEFVAFLDSDDIWHSQKLQKQLEIMNSTPEVGLVYGQHYIIDELDHITGLLKISNRGKLFNMLLNGNTIAGSASMVLIRRDILNMAGFFREDLINGEDWEMWMRISLLCDIDYSPDILASIRSHQNSAQKNTRLMTESILYAYKVISDEYILNDDQKHQLACYCIYNAAVHYYDLGLFDESRDTLRFFLKESPRSAKSLNNWLPRINIQNGPFTKIMLTQPLLSGVIRILKFPLRAIRKIYRILKNTVKRVMRRLKKLIPLRVS